MHSIWIIRVKRKDSVEQWLYLCEKCGYVQLVNLPLNKLVVFTFQKTDCDKVKKDMASHDWGQYEPFKGKFGCTSLAGKGTFNMGIRRCIDCGSTKVSYVFEGPIGDFLKLETPAELGNCGKIRMRKALE